MNSINDRIVEPANGPGIDVLAEGIFTDARWPADDARWLAQLTLVALPQPASGADGLDPLSELNLSIVARAWKDSGALGSRDRALLIAYARLIGCGGREATLARPVTFTDSSESVPGPGVDPHEVAQAFRSHGADFEGALVRGGWPGDYGGEAELAGSRSEYMRGTVPPLQEVPEIHRLMRALVEHAGLDLTKVVDFAALVGIGTSRSGPDPAMPLRVPTPVDRTQVSCTDPRSLVTWLVALGPSALSGFLPELRRQPNADCFAAMAVGIQDAIERWLFFASGHWSYFWHGGSQLAEATEPILEELERRYKDGGTESRELRRAWLWFAGCTYEAGPQRLAPERRELILRAANEDLAALRPLFARATPKSAKTYAAGEGIGLLPPGSARAPWEEFEWQREHFETCAVLLFHLGGVWRGMKPLLLALRAMACPSVARDLRYWNEQRPVRAGDPPDELTQPPEPWSLVPAAMINLFHAYVGREQEEDRELEALRGHLAGFCLRGLADRWSAARRRAAEISQRPRSNDDMLEHSPEWRLCLIRAAMALHINPEGKGHRILDAASRLDPMEDVRAAAHEAYEKLRRANGLPDDVSPRRAVMTALWWIRQAHLLGLNVELDRDGAQRTRVKELTRTKDQERAERQ